MLGVATDVAVYLVSFQLETDRIAIGDYQGANRVNAPKVFKRTRRKLERGNPQSITRRHAFKHGSIRRIRPDPHLIELQLNGKVAGAVTVDITEP